MPLAEFVEIYNPSKDTVSLNNWKFSDPSTKATIKNVKIPPQEYLILCAVADTAQYKFFGRTIGLSPWPSLNNSGDQITLKSDKGRPVDSVAYSDYWYHDNTKKAGGWSLEKRIFISDCSGFYNWAASINEKGGTPGVDNSISGKEKLRVDSIQVTSDSTLSVYLNQIPDTLSVNPSAFTINNRVGGPGKITLAEPDYRTLHLEFNNRFSKGETYTLTINSLQTCSGAIINSPENAITFTIPVVPEQNYPVVINEIFADPAPIIGLPESEFIELFNPSDSLVNLKGLVYSDARNTSYTFTSGSIDAKGYLIICAVKDTLSFKSSGKVFGIYPFPSLNNTEETLVLKNSKGKEFQRVTYNLAWYKDKEKQQGGYSLEMINPNAVCSGIQNWAASKADEGGTPGTVNSVFSAASNEPIKLVYAEIRDPSTLLLGFNRSVDSLSASSAKSYLLNNAVGNPLSVEVLGPDFDTVKLKFRNQISRGKVYQVEVAGITDCSGAVISSGNNSGEFNYPDQITRNDILINEILFNPRPGGADFVEIYNNSDKTFDLKELAVATMNDKDSLVSIKRIAKEQILFKPKEFLAITTDPGNIGHEYLVRDPKSIMKTESLPAFNDDAGVVVLLAGNERIDQLNYSEKMHFGLIKDAEGASLERSSFKNPTNASGNFRSAAAIAGFGTPGYKNSQYAEETSTTDEVALTSKTFSPDNDGFEDALSINYHFAQPGLVANTSVFTDQGVLIRRIQRNQTLAGEGSVVWDGLTEQNEKASVGIYVVFMEVFDLKGNVKKYRKACVLAAKLD